MKTIYRIDFLEPQPFGREPTPAEASAALDRTIRGVMDKYNVSYLAAIDRLKRTDPALIESWAATIRPNGG